jgi:hypothetical protein
MNFEHFGFVLSLVGHGSFLAGIYFLIKLVSSNRLVAGSIVAVVIFLTQWLILSYGTALILELNGYVLLSKGRSGLLIGYLLIVALFICSMRFIAPESLAPILKKQWPIIGFAAVTSVLFNFAVGSTFVAIKGDSKLIYSSLIGGRQICVGSFDTSQIVGVKRVDSVVDLPKIHRPKQINDWEFRLSDNRVWNTLVFIDTFDVDQRFNVGKRISQSVNSGIVESTKGSVPQIQCR